MLFGENRSDLRSIYVRAWQKAQDGQPMEPLEQLVAEVVADHPEYQALLAHPDVLEQDFTVESGQTNPFLHMGLHLAIREQVATDHPGGIRQAHQTLLAVCKDAHEAEHKIIDCLAEVLWQAQRDGTVPNEIAYLAAVQNLAK